MVWMRTGQRVDRGHRLFLAQLTLNFAWSFLFFGLAARAGARRILVLWVFIALTVLLFSRQAPWRLSCRICSG
jgi:tryptophan-rich sensory protein